MALLANFSGSALLWWARSFSNAWNPYYSMIANLIVLLVLVLSSIFMEVHQEYALAGALIVNTLFSLTFLVRSASSAALTAIRTPKHLSYIERKSPKKECVYS